jgi:hypothetical protein
MFICPNCNNTESIDVVVITQARLSQHMGEVETDTGDAVNRHHEWDNDSFMSCDCGYVNKAEVFEATDEQARRFYISDLKEHQDMLNKSIDKSDRDWLDSNISQLKEMIKSLDYEVTVLVTDSAEHTLEFKLGFCKGAWFETEAIGSLSGHTVHAEINDIVIDGNGWRDIEDGGYLETYCEDVVRGGRDPNEFLANISEALNSQPSGKVIG